MHTVAVGNMAVAAGRLALHIWQAMAAPQSFNGLGGLENHQTL
jgi:hypothetical protein